MKLCGNGCKKEARWDIAFRDGTWVTVFGAAKDGYYKQAARCLAHAESEVQYNIRHGMILVRRR